MSRELPPYGARALRRALATLESLASPVDRLCAPVRQLAALVEVEGGSAGALTQPPAFDRLTGLLDALDGVEPNRQAAPVARRGAPALAPVATRAPRRGGLGDAAVPAVIATDGGAALRAAWPNEAAGRRVTALAPARARDARGGDASGRVTAAGVRRPLPPPVSDALAVLAAAVPWASAALAVPVAPVAQPLPAGVGRPVRAAGRPPAAPLPRVPADSSSARPDRRGDRSAASAHPAGPEREPAASAAPPSPVPRGLAGLATWWQAGQRKAPEPVAGPAPAVARATAIAGGVVEPVTAAPGHALGLGALSPSQRTVHDGRSDRDAPSLAAITSLDDVTRALERVLTRELRRHGVTTEEP